MSIIRIQYHYKRVDPLKQGQPKKDNKPNHHTGMVKVDLKLFKGTVDPNLSTPLGNPPTPGNIPRSSPKSLGPGEVLVIRAQLANLYLLQVTYTNPFHSKKIQLSRSQLSNHIPTHASFDSGQKVHVLGWARALAKNTGTAGLMPVKYGRWGSRAWE
ncbi:hypothetical protein DSO57_1006002 [Entomophthora muscae]|uniref:Uncharacterized protein n=1 Tax=Entomophthora muscae TaxID=34485 RepID=A0ACC2SKN6_9FUNG|nr:hypothetical protein DSO57_1006002 [Entomophthora muscae]